MQITTFEYFLNEHFVTIFPNDTEFHVKQLKYIDEIWTLLQNAYNKVGGFKSANSKEELMNKTNLWKLVIRDNKVVACRLYTTNKGGGRKSIAGGALINYIKDFIKIIDEDIKMKDREVWGEVSGAMETIIRKHDGKFIDAETATKILKNKILDLSSDAEYVNTFDNEKNPFEKGKHYVRDIKGNPYRKIMFGNLPKSLEI